MSFFDDDDFDEPTHVARAAPRPRGPRSGGPGAPPDPQTARTRQLVAVGLIVVVLILLTVAVSSCVKSGRKSALRDYSRDVTAVLNESRDEVAKPFFTALSDGGRGNDLQVRLNRLREQAESQAKRVQGFGPPGNDAGRAAQHDLELSMNLRADAVRRVAEQIPAALGDQQQSDRGVALIAGQMQALLASDVVVLERTAPLINQEQRRVDLSGVTVRPPRFVNDLGWLQPDTVAGNLGQSTSGGGSGSVRDRSGEQPKEAGTHGDGLGAAKIGDTTLTAGTPADVTGNEIQVQVTNSGDVDESDIEVGATFSAPGGKPVGATTKLATLAAQQTGTATIKLPADVPTGQQGELKIEVGGVPGEKNLDNNKQTFPVTFGG